MCTCPSGLVLKDGFLCVNKSAVCQRRQFACLNGNCVMDMQVCDKENDCGDNSDESSALCGKLKVQICLLGVICKVFDRKILSNEKFCFL